MTTSIAGVLAVWLLAVVSPGSAFLVLSRMAAGRSRAAALGTALGIALCALLFAALTMWGLAVVVTQISWLGWVLRIGGAVYLIYLGISLWRSHPGAATEIPAPAGQDALHEVRVGFLTGLREAYARLRTAIDRVLGSALIALGIRLGAQH